LTAEFDSAPSEVEPDPPPVSDPAASPTLEVLHDPATAAPGEGSVE